MSCQNWTKTHVVKGIWMLVELMTKYAMQLGVETKPAVVSIKMHATSFHETHLHILQDLLPVHTKVHLTSDSSRDFP